MKQVEESARPLLEAREVVKVFPGTVALDGINLELRRGEVHAVVGENGAGKSTLMKILSGAYRLNSGRIFMDGREVSLHSVEDAQQNGISMLYQELANVPKLSVAENIFLGLLPRKGVLGLVDFRTLFRRTQEYFDAYKVNIDPKASLSRLTLAEKQFVEIIRVITAKNARIVIMDEPTSSLTKSETEQLFTIIRELKKRGVTIVYISHRLDEVQEIADRISVFRDGKNVGTLEREEYDERRIIMLMLGQALMRLEKERAKAGLRREKVLFEVRDLSIKRRVAGFSMKLYEGEILAIAGLMGSGKDELVKCLFGLWPAESKQVRFRGQPVDIRSPQQAIDHGVVYLPEERKLTSLFLELSVKHNISPLWLFNVRRRFLLQSRPEEELARSAIAELSIKTPSSAEQIMNLSGGNQQKAVFSRLIALRPTLMILNDPTRGVDVGSKEEIYRIIQKLVSQGTSIILVSSEIGEICYLADRVIVLSKGEVHGEFADDQVTMENVLTCALRAKKNEN